MTKNASIEVRSLQQVDLPQALALVERVFMAFEAPDYSDEGVETFRTFIRDAAAVSSLTFYGALEHGVFLGVLATRVNSHIALFFVDAAQQGRGVGRALFEAAKSACRSDRMTVNSSPYAVEIYRHLGFSPILSEQVRDGIRYTPMQFIFQKES